MRPVISLLFLAALLAGQDSADRPEWQRWLTRGTEAYKAGNYPQAVQALEKAVELNPDNVSAHTVLANSRVALYVPGDNSPKNLDLAKKAEAEFAQVLNLAPENKLVVLSLGSLNYQEALGMSDADQQLQKFDQARYWYEKAVEIDPSDKQAYCNLGAIDWSKWFLKWINARLQLHMPPTDPGPLPDPAVRGKLREQYNPTIESGIWSLQKALEIDPGYADAMDYMNLFTRERADLRDTKEEYLQDIQAADQWAGKALANQNSAPASFSAAVLSEHAAGSPEITPINAVVPFRTVDPAYPPLARQAGVQGVVRFRAFIGKDGRVRTLQLVNGNPLLVQAARAAAQQWQYQTTVLGGAPVDVLTDLSVSFALRSR